MIWIGGILGGGHSAREAEIVEALRRLHACVHQASQGIDDEFSLDIVAMIDGPIAPNDFSGVRTGTLSRKRQSITIQIGIDPDTVPEGQVMSTLSVLLRQAADLADAELRRRVKHGAPRSKAILDQCLDAYTQ